VSDLEYRVLDAFTLTNPDIDHVIVWQARAYNNGSISVWIHDPAPRMLHESDNLEHAETDIRVYAEVAQASFGGVLTREG
jgi:hypothetical protein